MQETAWQEFLAYLSAVASWWYALIPGLALTFIDVYERGRNEEFPIPGRWLLRMFVAGFIFAQTMTYFDLRKEVVASRPDLEVVIDQIIANYNTAGYTAGLVEMGVVNHGAESAVTYYQAHYRSPTLDQDVEVIWMSAGAEEAAFPKEYQTIEGDVGNIMRRTQSPIARGTIVPGKLFVQIPGNHALELTKGSGVLTITVRDYLNRESSGDFPNTNKAAIVLPFHRPCEECPDPSAH